MPIKKLAAITALQLTMTRDGKVAMEPVTFEANPSDYEDALRTLLHGVVSPVTQLAGNATGTSIVLYCDADGGAKKGARITLDAWRKSDQTYIAGPVVIVGLSKSATIRTLTKTEIAKFTLGDTTLTKGATLYYGGVMV